VNWVEYVVLTERKRSALQLSRTARTQYFASFGNPRKQRHLGRVLAASGDPFHLYVKRELPNVTDGCSKVSMEDSQAAVTSVVEAQNLAFRLPQSHQSLPTCPPAMHL
jgi:hypothetical protein